MAGPYVLSLAAVDILSQTLALNTRVFPFEIPSVGTLQQDRIRIAKAVFGDLRRRGLIRPNGEVDLEVQRALRALASYRVAVTAMGALDLKQDIQLLARASADGETGVLAVQEGQKIRLQPIRPTGLAAAIVGLLPRMAAGPGQSVTLTRPAPVRAHARAETDNNPFATVQRPRGGGEQSLRIAQSYLSRPRTGAGFFAVLGRDRNGRDVQLGEVGWYDTDQGRYLSLSRPPVDGQIHGTFSPADPSRLIQQLTGLIESAAART